MIVLRILGMNFMFLLHLMRLWLWVIPTRLTILAIGLHLVLMYSIFGTVHVQEIKNIFNKNETAYFFGFTLPFSFPMFLSFLSAFAFDKMRSNETSLEQAIRFRNGQMRVKPPIEASKILRKTAYLDVLNSDESDVYESARRGYDASYSHKPPTEIFKDLMKDD